MSRFWRRRGDGGCDGGSQHAGPSPGDAAQVGEPASFLDHTEEGMVLIEGRIVRWLNPAARLIFSAAEHPTGRPLVEVVRDHRIEALVARVQQAAVEQTIEVELPLSGRRLQARAVPFGNEAIGLLVRDVSRIRYLETVRQQFVGNLSHEMRTPLAGLDLAAQTLSNQLPPDGDARAFIDRIIQESQRLQAILRNLTQLAALDAAGIEAERAPFSVTELVQELVDRYQPRAVTRSEERRVEPTDRRVDALGDRGKTDQALQNIVDNAL